MLIVSARPVLLPLLLSLSTMAIADYGRPAVAMGGLIPIKPTPDVQLRTQTVEISETLIKADYVLANLTEKEVELPLKFELPRYFSQLEGPSPTGVPRGFKIKINGKHATFKTTVTAVQCERDEAGTPREETCKDITTVLRDLGLTDGQMAYYNGGPPPDGKLRKKVLPSATPDQYVELVELGLLDDLGDETAWPNLPGNWGVDVSYSWSVKLAPKQVVSVAHEYVPFTGEGDQSEGHTAEELTTRFCADKKTLRAWDRMRTGEPTYRDPSRFGPGGDVRYSLADAKLWQGPTELLIKVKRAKGRNVVATCFKGLKKVSPSVLQAKFTELAPVGDVHVMFLRAEEEQVVTQASPGYGATNQYAPQFNQMANPYPSAMGQYRPPSNMSPPPPISAGAKLPVEKKASPYPK